MVACVYDYRNYNLNVCTVSCVCVCVCVCSVNLHLGSYISANNLMRICAIVQNNLFLSGKRDKSRTPAASGLQKMSVGHQIGDKSHTIGKSYNAKKQMKKWIHMILLTLTKVEVPVYCKYPYKTYSIYNL